MDVNTGLIHEVTYLPPDGQYRKAAMGIAGAALAFAMVVLTVCLMFLSFNTVVKSAGLRAWPASGSSMEPMYHDGDLVVTKEVSSITDVREGDVIVFEPSWKTASGSKCVSHRAINFVATESGGWQTKGDNNASMDPGIVERDAIAGVEVLHLNGMGWMAGHDNVTLVLGVLLCVFIIAALVSCLLVASGRVIFTVRQRMRM